MRPLTLAFSVVLLCIAGYLATLGSTQTGPNVPAADALAWDAARVGRDPQRVARYLSTYPDGAFQDDALALLNELLGDGAQVARLNSNPVSFSAPLSGYNSIVDGQSIDHLLTKPARHAPIEGLRTDLWENRTCGTCHNWTVAQLCQQAQMYTAPGFDVAQEGQHPYGVEFKLALGNWSQNGCQ